MVLINMSTGKFRTQPVSDWLGTKRRWPCWWLRRLVIIRCCLRSFSWSSGWLRQRTWSCGWRRLCWTTRCCSRTTCSRQSRISWLRLGTLQLMFNIFVQILMNFLAERTEIRWQTESILLFASAVTVRYCMRRRCSSSLCLRSWRSIWVRSGSSHHSSLIISKSRLRMFLKVFSDTIYFWVIFNKMCKLQAMPRWRCAADYDASSCRKITTKNQCTHREQTTLATTITTTITTLRTQRTMCQLNRRRLTSWCWMKWWSIAAHHRTWATSICSLMANTSRPYKEMVWSSRRLLDRRRTRDQLADRWCIPRCRALWSRQFARIRWASGQSLCRPV